MWFVLCCAVTCFSLCSCASFGPRVSFPHLFETFWGRKKRSLNKSPLLDLILIGLFQSGVIYSFFFCSCWRQCVLLCQRKESSRNGCAAKSIPLGLLSLSPWSEFLRTWVWQRKFSSLSSWWWKYHSSTMSSYSSSIVSHWTTQMQVIVLAQKVNNTTGFPASLQIDTPVFSYLSPLQRARPTVQMARPNRPVHLFVRGSSASSSSDWHPEENASTNRERWCWTNRCSQNL